MKCKKVRYKDHQQAFSAIQKIKNNSDRAQVPTRAYECDLCNGWHLTKSEIQSGYEPKQRLRFKNIWNKLINANN